MTEQIDNKTLEYLDDVAAIVVTILEANNEAQKIGEPPNDNQKALLTLGEAYMYLYNRLLDETTFDE